MEYRSYVNSYKPVTRVGNWNEDLFLKAELDADYADKKAKGLLKYQKADALRAEFLSEVVTSPHGDRQVRFGDIVMLKNIAFNKTVSVFSDNKLHWIISGSSEEKSVKQNSFKIVPFDPILNEALDKKPLLYTQPFALQSVVEPGLYLASDSIRKLQSISNISYGRNDIFLEKRISKLTMWHALDWDPTMRLETELTPVFQSNPLVLNHHSTGQALCCESDLFKWSPFGKGNQISCSTRITPYKTNHNENCFSLSVNPE